MDHVTEVFVVPLTVAAKVALWPSVNVALVGDKPRLMLVLAGVKVTVAVAFLVVSTTLVALTVTVCALETVAGAV